MIGMKKFQSAMVKGTACICFAVLAFAFTLQGALAYSVTVATDKSSYSRGAMVIISGTVTPQDAGVYVGVEVRGPGGGTAWIDMVETDSSGNYVSPFRLDPSAPYGVYTVYASPEASNTVSWCEFTIPEPVQTTTRTIRGRTETVTTVATTTIAESTTTESVHTFTIGTTETSVSRETVSVTTSVTLTKTRTATETASATLTGTETATASTTVAEPIWHRIQFGLLLLIPFLLVGIALGVFVSKIVRRRRRENRRRTREE